VALLLYAYLGLDRRPSPPTPAPVRREDSAYPVLEIPADAPWLVSFRQEMRLHHNSRLNRPGVAMKSPLD